MKIYGIIGIGSLILALALIIINMSFSAKQRRTGSTLREKENKKFWVYIALYRTISQIPIINELLESIRKRIEIYTVSDEKTLRKKSVLLLMTTVAAFFTSITLFWVITKDWFLLILFIVLLAFIGDTIIELFINNLQNNLLRQQLRYLELLRHKYYEQKSVEEANIEACDQLNQKGSFEVYTQAERINDILSSRDLEEELEKYYETAPNKYFKMLAGIIYITKEYGDTYLQGNSIFIRCVTYLGNEIKAELHKREKLKYALRSLNTISLLPLFILKPMRNWAAESFAPLQSFYTSKLGIVLGIATILSSIISYIILRQLHSFDKQIKIRYTKKSFEQRIYNRFLYRIVDRIAPKSHTQKGNSMTTLIKNAMVPLDIYTLYTRKIMIGCLAFIFGIIMFIGLNIYSNNAILYNPQIPEGYLGGKLSEDDLKRLQDITDFDRNIILQVGKHADDSTILEIINEEDLNNQEAQIALSRIKEKIQRISSNILWYWQFLLCFIFFFAGYHSPVIGLKIVAHARKIDMEDEVSQFHTIILMLMHMNRIHVQELLEWMETFAFYFKEPLQKCLLNFSSGPQEALEEFKAEVSFPPLLTLIENLQLSCSDLEVSKAFEELENEMGFNSETRKETNERIVERKKHLGTVIGFMPVYALILFYLIIPMIVSGMESLSAFYEQLSEV